MPAFFCISRAASRAAGILGFIGVRQGATIRRAGLKGPHASLRQSIPSGKTVNKNLIYSALLCVVSTVVALGAAELLLRVKNSSMKNYDIEMWRYAKELKTPSLDPSLGHEHVKNASALLQSVDIRLNEWGLRGGPVMVPAPPRRILVLGGSITLGWGVAEKDTMPARLQQRLRQEGEDVEVLNGGVGNYNAERYIERFFTQLEGLHPTDIVVQYFLRDAEKLDPGGGNILLRNSELAVTTWIAFTRLANKSGEQSLVDHYKDVYREDQPGYIEMRKRLKMLADYAHAHNIRLFMAMTPDVHDLANYRFGFIHDRMKAIASEDGMTYVDFLPALGKRPPEEVWAMPGDPHPNALAQGLMADALLPVLRLPSGAPSR
jgi:lysophospholipase L1-like esterase